MSFIDLFSDGKTDAEKMPPPSQPTNAGENSFDNSVGMLRRHKRRKENSEQNKTFVFKQLSALEYKNKGIITVFAKLRQRNSKLEQDNYEFKQKQISFLVKNAAVNRKLKDSKIENEKLMKKLEAKKRIITQALWLRRQFESIVTAIDSDQQGLETNLSLESPIVSQMEKEISNFEDDTNTPDSTFHSKNASLDSITQRPRRVLKRDIEVKNSTLPLDGNDSEALSICNTSSEGGLPKRMPALSEKEEVSSEEKDDDSPSDVQSRRKANNPINDEPCLLSGYQSDEVENSTFEDVLNECTHDLNLNISEESEPINASVTSTQNVEEEIVRPAAYSNINESAENIGNCDETNQSYDVIMGENCDTKLKEGVCNGNVFTLLNVLSDSSNIRHREPQDASRKVVEKQNFIDKRNAAKPSATNSKKTSMKKKFVKSKNDSDVLNKTSSYDFLSCSSDSFLLDEGKRIKLHDSGILNDENASPKKRTVRRRGKSAVSYAEPSLRAKLRRGDRISDDSLYNSPKRTFNKRAKNQRV